MVSIAKITAVFGLKGGVKLQLKTDFLQRFDQSNCLYVQLPSELLTLTVRGFIFSGKTPVVFFENFNDRESVERLIGKDILIKDESIRDYADGLDKDDFLYHDLIGCTVWHGNSQIGIVEDIIEGGGGHLLVLSVQNEEKLVPFVSSIVHTERISERRIYLTPPEGLFD